MGILRKVLSHCVSICSFSVGDAPQRRHYPCSPGQAPKEYVSLCLTVLGAHRTAPYVHVATAKKLGVHASSTVAGLLPALERMGKTATFLFQPTEVMAIQNDVHGTEGCFVKLELPAVLLLCHCYRHNCVCAV